MAETDSPTPDAPQPASKPYGPGVLMVFGLACLVVAAWCGWDLYLFYLAADSDQAKNWSSTTLLFNWAGMAGFLIGAIYAFVLAAKRSKPGGADSPGADAKTPESGA